MYSRITITNIVFIILILSFLDLVRAEYTVTLKHNGPIVKGGNITFLATLYKYGKLADGTYSFSWEDNAIPEHTREIKVDNNTDEWTVHYNASVYPKGLYNMQVVVYGYFINFVPYQLASARINFEITELLNGELIFIQNNKSRENIYVSNADTVIHKISLRPSDENLIKQATKLQTFWFIDCTYYGFTNSTTFSFNYTKPDVTHSIEALMIADFTPLPPPITTTPTPTTTTTVKPNTTTTTIKPNTTTTTTTVKPTSTTTVKPKRKRDISNSTEISRIKIMQNGTLVPYTLENFPFVCNGSRIGIVQNKTYGYFKKRAIVKAPISKLNITGNNWLQHGDLLELNIKCEGSQTLQYCIKHILGHYNVTGNETCSHYFPLDYCEFSIQRYFNEPTDHTVLIIIQNEVSKRITPVAVTVYEVKKQAQLSVIVVPVVSCIIAVVLIVFGVAYYIQNRSRYVVEVADFNFGQNYSDMEYKTFKERLRDSIINAFFNNRGPTPGSSEVPVWPPGRKYGSMTS